MGDTAEFIKKKDFRDRRLRITAVFQKKTFFADQQNIADENLVYKGKQYPGCREDKGDADIFGQRIIGSAEKTEKDRYICGKQIDQHGGGIVNHTMQQSGERSAFK